MTNYINKYLKYKNKYLSLKKGGYFNCPPEAKSGKNHQVIFSELIDNNYDNLNYGDKILQNRCSVCVSKFANEKIGECCHRICSMCRIKRNKCNICNNHINYIFTLNQDNTMWIYTNIPYTYMDSYMNDDVIPEIVIPSAPSAIQHQIQQPQQYQGYQ